MGRVLCGVVRQVEQFLFIIPHWFEEAIGRVSQTVAQVAPWIDGVRLSLSIHELGLSISAGVEPEHAEPTVSLSMPILATAIAMAMVVAMAWFLRIPGPTRFI